MSLTDLAMFSISDLQQQFKAYAAEHPFTKEPVRLYEPLDYILALGGKKMRPVLLLMACNLFKDEIKEGFAPAYGVELFHNFSLIHDDIMDEAPMRRGKATVHELYDTNTAILSGDVMLVYAYQYMAQVRPELLPAVMEIFNRTAIGVCEGQQWDVNFETMTKVEIEQYLHMIELKTAVLLQGAMEIGALVGGANAEEAKKVAEIGRLMGVAFQLLDDYLDTFGDQATFGKRIGGDIVQNKKTYLVIKALELADEATAKELNTWMASTVEKEKEEEKIAAVTAIFERLGIPAEMEKIVQSYHKASLDMLSQINVSEERKVVLAAFCEKLIGRNH